MSLSDYIISKMGIPFLYGVNDCVLFAVGWLELSTGEKFLPEITWSTEREALKKIKKLGGLEKAFGKRLREIEANYAQDGDLTIVDGISYLFSGVHIVSVGQDGLRFKSRQLAKRAWTNG